MTGKQRKILVVDDNEILATLMQQMIESGGYSNVIVFCNSMEAKKYLLKNKISVLVTDLNMPEVTGFELIKIALEKNVHRIVAVSGNYAANKDLMGIYLENNVGFLSKPCSIDQLLEAVAV